MLGPTPKVSDSFSLWWDAMICIPTKLPSHADVAGSGISIITAPWFTTLLMSSILPTLSFSGDLLWHITWIKEHTFLINFYHLVLFCLSSWNLPSPDVLSFINFPIISLFLIHTHQNSSSMKGEALSILCTVVSKSPSQNLANNKHSINIGWANDLAVMWETAPNKS